MPSYIDCLKPLAKNGRMLLCDHCGYRTISIGQAAVCSNCELPIFYSENALKASKPIVFSHASKIYSLVSARRFDEARKECDLAYTETGELGYVYYEGLISIMASNDAVDSIEYNKDGFMEENSAFRNTATKEAAAARRYFNFIINAATLAGNERSVPPYLLFVSHIKLHNLKEAYEALNLIKSRNTPLLENYAEMMLQINLGSPDSTISAAKKLLSKDAFSVNALYYISEALADKKHYKEARQIALALLDKLPKRQVNRLIWRINSASSI